MGRFLEAERDGGAGAGAEAAALAPTDRPITVIGAHRDGPLPVDGLPGHAQIPEVYRYDPKHRGTFLVYETLRGVGGSADVSYLNHPVMFARGEALFPQDGDAGVEPALVVGWGGFLLLLAEAHLWIDNNNISYIHNISKEVEIVVGVLQELQFTQSPLEFPDLLPELLAKPRLRDVGRFLLPLDLRDERRLRWLVAKVAGSVRLCFVNTGSFSPTLILSSGRVLKASLHSGHSDLCLVSQKRLMHVRQKLWPHGVETGLWKISRHMTHRNCSSDNAKAMLLTEGQWF
ncbi:hypothetical protein EYF80_036387 [Liparis tanakae]|uniref:Uncharacterized protein n=1 Tax=Liparis tanakae TaxID=230148 RepID=A0A4Z2GJI8_9TELE|nr:hypothetical protein EYF80_036387 [Liparis tanakae]